MAACLSLSQAHFADFEAAFLEAATAMIPPEALHESIASDGELPADAFHIHNACALRDGGPWGQGFPEPLFAGEDRKCAVGGSRVSVRVNHRVRRISKNKKREQSFTY